MASVITAGATPAAGDQEEVAWIQDNISRAASSASGATLVENGCIEATAATLTANEDGQNFARIEGDFAADLGPQATAGEEAGATLRPVQRDVVNARPFYVEGLHAVGVVEQPRRCRVHWMHRTEPEQTHKREYEEFGCPGIQHPNPPTGLKPSRHPRRLDFKLSRFSIQGELIRGVVLLRAVLSNASWSAIAN